MMNAYRRGIPLALMIVVSACTSAQGAGEETPTGEGAATESDPSTIVFESYNYGSPGLGGAGTESLLEGFAGAHPDIVVQPIGTPDQEILTSVQSKVAAGDPPDVAQLSQGFVRFIGESLPYVPIDELAGEEWESYTEDFVPQALDICRVDGKYVGVPYTISTGLMYYNADLFREAGLDPEDPPSTWDELKQAALTITEKTDAEGINIGVLGAYDFLGQSLIMSNGGLMMDDSGTDPMFDEPEAIEAVEMLQDLVQSGAHISSGFEEASAAFESGRLAMIITTSARLASTVDNVGDRFELATAQLPRFGDKELRISNSGSCLYVLADDEASQRAAWEFIKYVTGPEGYTIITSEIGYVPLRESIVDDPAYLGGYLEENPLVVPSIDQLEYLVGRRSWAGPRGLEALQIFQDALEEVMVQGADASSTLKAAADRISEMLAS